MVMSRMIAVLLLAIPACSEPIKPASAPPPEPVSPARPVNPAEFKYAFRYRDLQESASLSGEWFFRDGRAYRFVQGADEVLVLDSKPKMVRFLDLRRKVTAELPFAIVEKSIEQYRADLREGIEASEAENTRGGRVEAAMDRDLLDPRFKVESVSEGSGFRLTNPTVEVDATGEPDTIEGRIGRIGEAFAIGVKLQALRFPEALPPFAQLDSLDILIASKKLRPVSLSYLFRLTGPPEKYEWTYTLTSALTERDWEALKRIDATFLTARSIRFDRYERLIDRGDRP